MAIEIPCADFRDFWSKIGGVMSKNVFWINLPAGGNVTALSEKSGAEVLRECVCCSLSS